MNMNCCPIYYTYLLFHEETNFKYYGCQYGKLSNPDNFWVTYFTSSKKVKKLINKYGKTSFVFEIRKTFDDPIKCRQWEIKVIKRAKLTKRKDFLNQYNPGGLDGFVVRKNFTAWNAGLAGKGDERCHNKMKGKTGIWSEEQLQNLSYKSSREYQISKFGEEQYYKKYKTGGSANVFGKIWINDGVIEKRIFEPQLNDYSGFVKGKLKRIYINNGEIEKSIIQSKLEYYSQLGFVKGNLPRVRDEKTGKFIKQQNEVNNGN